MTIYLVVAVICVSASVDLSGPAVIDRTTNESWIDADPAVSLDPARAAGPRQKHVVWDTTHGVYLTYYPQTRYSIMLNMLTDSGYTVDVFGGGLNTIDLDQYDVIVICLGTSWYSAYGQEEVDSIYAFYSRDRQRVVLTGDMNFCENTYIVNADNVSFAYNVFDWLSSNGGGVLIMGDNTGCPNANINPINGSFAMQSGIASLNPADLYFSNFGAFSIFDGITQIYYRAAGSIAASAPAAEAAWTSANEPTIGLLDQSMAVKEIESAEDVRSIPRIDPNPFRGNATIAAASGGRIFIYNCVGRLCAATDGSRIGPGLKPGVYFIRVGDSAPVKAIKLQ